MVTINFWPILIASVIAFAIGALWYSPLLFGKQWMSLTGIKASDVSGDKARGMWKLYVIQFIVTLITFSVLGFIVAADGGLGAVDGEWMGFLAWLGFTVPIGVSGLLWEKKPLQLVLISTVSILLCQVIGGAIIGAWR